MCSFQAQHFSKTPETYARRTDAAKRATLAFCLQLALSLVSFTLGDLVVVVVDVVVVGFLVVGFAVVGFAVVGFAVVGFLVVVFAFWYGFCPL